MLRNAFDRQYKYATHNAQNDVYSFGRCALKRWRHENKAEENHRLQKHNTITPSFTELVNKGLIGTQKEGHTACHLQEETGTLPGIIAPHRVMSAEM